MSERRQVRRLLPVRQRAVALRVRVRIQPRQSGPLHVALRTGQGGSLPHQGTPLPLFVVRFRRVFLFRLLLPRHHRSSGPTLTAATASTTTSTTTPPTTTSPPREPSRESTEDLFDVDFELRGEGTGQKRRLAGRRVAAGQLLFRHRFRFVGFPPAPPSPIILFFGGIHCWQNPNG